MDHKAGRINSRQDGLTVDEHLHSGLFGAEEAQGDFIEARSYRKNSTLVFIPEEILWACVDTLDFPRHCVTIAVKLAGAPDPASRAVLLTEHFVEGLLRGESTLEVSSIDLLLNLLMHLLECFVDVVDVYEN